MSEVGRCRADNDARFHVETAHKIYYANSGRRGLSRSACGSAGRSADRIAGAPTTLVMVARQAHRLGDALVVRRELEHRAGFLDRNSSAMPPASRVPSRTRSACWRVLTVVGREIGPGLGDADRRLAGLQLADRSSVIQVSLEVERRHVGFAGLSNQARDLKGVVVARGERNARHSEMRERRSLAHSDPSSGRWERAVTGKDTVIALVDFEWSWRAANATPGTAKCGSGDPSPTQTRRPGGGSAP